MARRAGPGDPGAGRTAAAFVRDARKLAAAASRVPGAQRSPTASTRRWANSQSHNAGVA